MVLNAAVQMLREADDLKLKISKFKSGTSMLQDRNIWVTQQQLQQIYQKVLVLDLDYALDKKVEQDLWNVGFKQQIEALQAISKDKKSPHRSEGQAMLTWVLQAAAGFYLCLLHQICTTFKLDLPFRRRASLLGWAEGWGAGTHSQAVTGVLPPPAAARYISQHCLVHLGDLARYRQQLRVAHTFYRHALLVSAQSGQPYNQLALVARRRGRQLDAIYWHVRSLLVRAPFPPANANLATTLAAAANTRTREDLPVIPGITSQPSEQSTPAMPARLDAHNFVEEFIRAVHLLHTLEDLDAASQLVVVLNSSLMSLVATDSFQTMTLVKLSCIVMWLIDSNTEGLTLDMSQLTESECRAGNLSLELAAGALLALLLPAYTRELSKHAPSLPALKVWLQWLLAFPSVLRSAALVSRPQLWAALAHTLNQLCEYTNGFDDKMYTTIPLPEDEELHGFLPLESAFSTLKFTNYASWDTYGDRVPAYSKQVEEDQEGRDEDIFTLRYPSDMTEESLSKQPELEYKIRACRLINIGTVIAKQLETNGHDHFTVVKEEDKVSFSASKVDSSALTAALAELSQQRADEEPADEVHPPPIIISEADFREKVREKRVGILKPQGSLERAREERAQATQDDQDADCDDTSGDESKRECRKARMNVAMAAIMRKQEETNKQVKFVTPATTPDSTSDLSPSKEDKLKILQPKAIKSLANIPVGRKTGGILSLKDRSAGYPHLVNAEPETKVKNDDDKKHDVKSQTTQNPPKLSQEHAPNRVPNFIPRPAFQPKTVYPKVNFNSTYQPSSAGNQGIRLPVVNPKEIDVRSAAVQKQNSRQDLFQEGPKFNYQNISGDKKNFLNDLPPRFANQYKYWQQQNNQNENHFNTNQDNKFSDDSFRSNLQANRNWTPTGQQECPQPTWWKLPENFNYSPVNFQPNYYPANLSPNFQSSTNYTQNNNVSSTNYTQNLGQPQLQNLQIPSNFSSPMNCFGTYAGTVGYDSAMYPQFTNNSFPQMKMPEKPSGLNFSPGGLNSEPKRVSMFNDSVMKNVERGPITDRSGEGQGNTYSLFSAQDSGNWAPPQMQQSLWSGPGPSPLERLLEQQKQVKPPNEPQ